MDIKKLTSDPYNYALQISVKELEKLLRKLSMAYYNTGKALVSDAIFDVLKDTLEQRDPSNPFITEVGAISKDKVPLPFCMPSLDKIKPDTGTLGKWEKKYSGPYILSDKLDGVSGMIYKNKKGRYKLYTRGDKDSGQDISHLLGYVLADSVNLKDIPNDTAIRGELIISKKNFKSFTGVYKNARNTVAGLVNAKKYKVPVAEATDFVAYAVIHPRHTIAEQIKLLKKWNFTVVHHTTKKSLDNDSLSKYLKKRRGEGTYDIDGIVVVDNGKKHKYTDCNPTYAFAFKTVLTDQVAEVTVLDVEWNVSKDKYLKPRVKVTPVTLVGVTVQYATGFNAAFIEKNKIGPGAIIELVRSGDVIPHITKVIKPADKPKMPAEKYYWTESGVDIIAEKETDTVTVKRLAYFFKTLGVKHVDEGILTKFVDNGYNSITKILQADTEDLAEIDGVGKKMVNKMFTNLEASFKKTTLPKLMAASHSFGRGMGSRRLKTIVDQYPDILNKTWSKKKMLSNIISIEGFDTITATQFVEGFDGFLKFYNNLKKHAEVEHLGKAKKKKSGGKFKGMSIVFTGFRSAEWEKLVEDEGGKISSSVSSNTSLVVYVEDKAGSKLDKAKKLGTKTMTKKEFEKKYV